MSFGRGSIESESSGYSLFRLRNGFLPWHRAHGEKRGPRPGTSAVGSSIIRVQVSGLFVVFDALKQRFRGESIPIKSAKEIRLQSAGNDLAFLRQATRLLRREMCLNLIGDGARHFTLH